MFDPFAAAFGSGASQENINAGHVKWHWTCGMVPQRSLREQAKEVMAPALGRADHPTK
jgi:hypothetical protein